MTKNIADKKCLLLALLIAPEEIKSFDNRDWEILIRQGRAERLLAKVCARLKSEKRLDQVPAEIKPHLTSALAIADRHAKSVAWEVDRIQEALKSLNIEIVLLKGAAYLLSGCTCASGRLYNDVDVLFAKDQIADVEHRLIIKGWVHEELDEYDNQYYRRWTHEIPPLRHRRRGSVLDVHHAISPDIFRHPMSYHDLIDGTYEVMPGVRVLAKEDMLLHAVVHLINEEDFTTGFRDIVDIRDLVDEFSIVEGFWISLIKRVHYFRCQVPVYYALMLLKRMFGTSIPEEVILELKQSLPMVKRYISQFMIPMLNDVLLPKDKACIGNRKVLSTWLLYVRGHYLRMPLYLLIPHLIRKSFKRKKYQ